MNRKTAPSYGQGSSKRGEDIKPFKIPAANAYNPNMTFTQKSAAKWGFGSE